MKSAEMKNEVLEMLKNFMMGEHGKKMKPVAMQVEVSKPVKHGDLASALDEAQNAEGYKDGGLIHEPSSHFKKSLGVNGRELDAEYEEGRLPSYATGGMVRGYAEGGYAGREDDHRDAKYGDPEYKDDPYGDNGGRYRKDGYAEDKDYGQTQTAGQDFKQWEDDHCYEDDDMTDTKKPKSAFKEFFKNRG